MTKLATAAGAALGLGVAVFAYLSSREIEHVGIAAGTPGDSFFEVGTQLRGHLEERGHRSRVHPTGGSVDNLKLLGELDERGLEYPVVALVQHDTALAAQSNPASVYNGGLWSHRDESPAGDGAYRDLDIAPGVRRIATVHRETLYALANTEWLAEQGAEASPVLAELQPSLVCLGPEASGTQDLARAVLAVSPESTTGGIVAKWLTMPLRPMFEMLSDGSLELGFALLTQTNPLLEGALASGQVTAVSLSEETLAHLVGDTIHRASEGSLTSVQTDVLLVANRWVSDEMARELAQAISDSHATFWNTDVAEDEKLRRMVHAGSSIPLHEASGDYYRSIGLLPDGMSPTPYDMALAVAGILVVFVLTSREVLSAAEVARMRLFLQKYFVPPFLLRSGRARGPSLEEQVDEIGRRSPPRTAAGDQEPEHVGSPDSSDQV